jgi:asparagine synthase (glutamine-hydrolysing)
MLGANPATRAFMMPAQVGNPEMKAIERRLGWLPATLNASAAMIAGMAPILREDLVARIRGYQPLMSALDRLPLAQRVTGRDRLNQVLYLNSKTVLPNFILNYLADRMEMAHSIEGRVPFLDHLVAEAAARVPVSIKVKGIREKHVLREATNVPQINASRGRLVCSGPRVWSSCRTSSQWQRASSETDACQDRRAPAVAREVVSPE